MTINKTTQFTVNPNSIPVVLSTGDQDLESAFEQRLFVGLIEPSSPSAYQRWWDTTTNQLKERDGTNTSWRIVAEEIAGQLIPHSAGQNSDSRYARLTGGDDANFTSPPKVNGTGTLVENTSGVVIQNAFVSTGEVVSTVNAIAYDDTIPQITEGEEALSITFTPKRSDSRIRITSTLQLAVSVANAVRTNAVFVSTQPDAIAVAAEFSDSAGGNSGVSSVHAVADISSGDTSSRTFSSRFGRQGSGTAYLNATGGGIRRYGGAYASTLEIVEYMP